MDAGRPGADMLGYYSGGSHRVLCVRDAPALTQQVDLKKREAEVGCFPPHDARPRELVGSRDALLCRNCERPRAIGHLGSWRKSRSEGRWSQPELGSLTGWNRRDLDRPDFSRVTGSIGSGMPRGGREA